MNEKLIKLKEFKIMLESYKNTLSEMNELTDMEIMRVTALEENMSENNAISGQQASMFINKQMNSFLDKLEALVKEIPDYTIHGCFPPEEIELIRQRSLAKIKELVDMNTPDK